MALNSDPKREKTPAPRNLTLHIPMEMDDQVQLRFREMYEAQIKAAARDLFDERIDDIVDSQIRSRMKAYSQNNSIKAELQQRIDKQVDTAITEVLRDQNFDTTEIYAKLDKKVDEVIARIEKYGQELVTTKIEQMVIPMVRNMVNRTLMDVLKAAIMPPTVEEVAEIYETPQQPVSVGKRPSREDDEDNDLPF